jgi:outer membrane protein OmpA-like peptidoglycan-associated protein
MIAIFPAYKALHWYKEKALLMTKENRPCSNHEECKGLAGYLYVCILGLVLTGCSMPQLARLDGSVPAKVQNFSDSLAQEYRAASYRLGGHKSGTREASKMAQKGNAAVASKPEILDASRDWQVGHFERPKIRTLRNYTFALVEMLRDQGQFDEAARLHVAAELLFAREQQYEWEERNWAPGITDRPLAVEMKLKEERKAFLGMLAVHLYQVAGYPVEDADFDSGDRYLFFFDHDDFALSQFQKILLAAISEDAPTRLNLVEVEGHTDTVGRNNYNLGLSQKRGDSLIVASEKLFTSPTEVHALGEEQLLQQTPESTSAPRNRRATLSLR